MLRSPLRRSAVAALSLICISAGCDTWPKLGGVPVDDLPNHMCEPETPETMNLTISRSTPPRVVVHAIRGFGDISSIGLDLIVNRLTAAGVQAAVHAMPDYQIVGESLAAQYNNTRPVPAGIVLIGHSWGADEAIQLAINLKKKDVPIRLLLMIDATNPQPIPDNVDRCIHFYVPWPGDPSPDLLPGQPLVRAPGNTRTQLVNDSLGSLGIHPELWCVTHMGIDMSAYVHRRVMEEIFALPD
jgi:hypothetical protein